MEHLTRKLLVVFIGVTKSGTPNDHPPQVKLECFLGIGESPESKALQILLERKERWSFHHDVLSFEILEVQEVSRAL